MQTICETNINLGPALLTYELTTTQVDDFEQMSYTTYGICVRDENGTELLSHKDISVSKEYVETFIKLLKDNDVALFHINDVLEDYLD